MLSFSTKAESLTYSRFQTLIAPGDTYACATPGSSPCFGEFGHLLFSPNHPSDEIGNLINKVEISQPYGTSDTDFIRGLIETANSYDGKAFYDPLATSQRYNRRDLPGSGRNPEVINFPTYNSNSFVSGILSKNNVPRPSLTATRNVGGAGVQTTDTYWAPLFDHPVPDSHFMSRS